MTYSILLVSEVILSVLLIVLILIQHGKGADAGAAFGGGASGTVFGSRGAGSFLSRTTGVLAALFYMNCLALAGVISQQQTAPDSVIESVGSDIPSQESVVTSRPATLADVPESESAEAVKQVPNDIPQ